MIDGRIAGGLLERLAGLNWYPRDNPAATKDLAGALHSAKNDAIAVAVVNDWMESYSEAPKPAQLRALIQAENDKLARMSRAHCADCGGTGFALVQNGAYSGVKPCHCLPPTHHARPETSEYQEQEHEYWKPHWKYVRTEAS